MPIDLKYPQQNPYAGSELTGAANLASLFLPAKGNSSTSGNTTGNTTGSVSNNGTVTTTEGVSQQGVQQLIDNILSGNQGLAAVSSGQRQAGLYNSSTNQLMTNNLLAQAAGQAALLNKTTTQQTSNNQNTNQQTNQQTNQNTQQVQAARVSPKTAISGLGLLQLAGSSQGKALLAKLGIGGNTGTGGKTVAPVASVKSADGTQSQDLTNPDNTGVPPNPNIAPTSSQVSVSAAPTAGTDTVSDVQKVLGNPQYGNLGSGSNPGLDLGSGWDSGLDSNLSSSDNSFVTSDSYLSGADSLVSDSGLGAGSDLASGLDTSNLTGVDWASASIDPSMGYNFDFGDLGFASGGLVGEAARALAVGNPAAEAAFNSGGDDSKATTGAKNSSDSGDNKPVSTSDSKPAYHNAAADLITKIRDAVKGFASGGMVSKNDGTYTQSRPARMIMPVFAKGGYVDGKAIKGVMNAHAAKYASGGMVDLTNTGLRIVGDGNITSPLDVAVGDQSIASRARNSINQSGNTTTPPTTAPIPKTTGTGSANTGSLKSQRDNGVENGPSGENVGTTNGPVGTPGQNNAAVTGFALDAIGMALGVPGLSAVSNAIGIPSHSMNPVSNVINAIVSSVTGGNDGTVDGSVAAEGVTGQSTSTASTASSTGSVNSSTPSQGLDNAVNDAIASLGLSDSSTSSAGGNDGTSAEGGGIGGTGNSAGDSTSGDGSGDGGVGDGVGSDGGTAAAATGKYIEGPGTSTSDSIPAFLSDGEYVLNADAVKAIGPDVLDQINNLFKPSPSKLAQGRAIHNAQFGSK